METSRTNSSLKIGYIMQNGAPDLSTLSGPQLHTLAVIKGLQKCGHQVRTVAIQNKKILWSDDLNQWSDPDYTVTKSKWFRILESLIRRTQSELKLPFLGLFDSIRFADACRNQLKDFDILYERHGYLGYGGLLASRWLKIPLVTELNGNIIQEIDENGVQMSPLQRKIGQWVTYKTWSNVDHLVAVSDSLQQVIRTQIRIPDKKITVVKNGVNINLFTKAFDKKQIRTKFDIASEPLVVFVGSFAPWHGVSLLISSFKRILPEFPTSQLILVGDGPLKEDIEKQIETSGLTNHVVLLGRISQPEVAEVLSISDVAAAPYPYQHSKIVGTPLKMLEYMAAGKAIIASTSPIHDLVTDGVNGLRILQADEEALANGILRLLKDEPLSAKLGANAYDEAIKKYSWDVAVGKLETILHNQCISRKV